MKLKTFNDIPHDKKMHIMAGLAIYAATLFIMIFAELTYINPVNAVAVVYVAAIGKEVYDYFAPNHNAEVADFVATVALPTIIAAVIDANWG